jgi:hypothetical protein
VDATHRLGRLPGHSVMRGPRAGAPLQIPLKIRTAE